MINKIKAGLNHAGFQKYFFNTSWLVAEQIFRMVVGFFVTVWVTRYLGPQNFGLFSYAISFVALFSTIATLGLDGIVVRELVKGKYRRDALMGTTFGLKIIGAFVAILLIAIVTLLTSNSSHTNALILIIAGAMIFRSFSVIDIYFQSKVLSKYVVYANTITTFISSIVKVVLVLNNAPLIAFAYIVLFDSAVLAIGFLYFYLHNNLSLKAWNFDKILAVLLLKSSWPLMLSGIMMSVYMKIDQVMIKEMLDSNAVGYYAAAVRLSEVWYFIPMVMTFSLFPAIVNAKIQDEKLYYIRLQRLYNLMVWLAIAIALPISVSASWIVNLLYGEQYNPACNVLAIHIWASIFVFLSGASSQWLLAENLQLFSAKNTAIGALLNVILNYILIRHIGIEGAAWATIISYFVAGYLMLSFHKKTRTNFILLSKSLLLWRIFYVKKFNQYSSTQDK